ncbi:TraR/DksA C4-type zinc finger protein [Brevibacillus centrosporus]|uniref:TraR/DksA C4-type zinc finger protein n=2 Tax=Brevibacillus centrosporus TaxID=54910 RepID=UPI000F0A0053|nr:TraR/DksA C4-type zinc finger protein [Brevibacillus centrosporus]MEC2128183.1 TraR/DksA C4-type zinc finger protein [Brevibacillus centrosporus]MED1951567.1 TraR/DksA C4-type zinc finger protein [Brevibacillus centrosporus]RNB73952.1 molecular chaperone DnaK [Brevibacillus centrosporus]
MVSGVDQDKLTLFRVKLLEQKKELEDRVQDHYGMREPMTTSLQEFAMYDNHPADIGSELFEREKDLALDSLDRETLKEIDQALTRMDEGTYGTCTVCGAAISEERLEALPQAQTCKEHAPAPTINESRPIEEEFLMPPFGRTSLDEKEGQNGFDGEDAWQIVEAWGTSSTPFSYVDNDKTDYKEMYIESDEPDGFVEDVEEIGYTDIDGYHGQDSVHFMRSGTYEEYMRKGEGKGNYLNYDDYEDERAEREGRNDLM